MHYQNCFICSQTIFDRSFLKKPRINIFWILLKTLGFCQFREGPSFHLKNDRSVFAIWEVPQRAYHWAFSAYVFSASNSWPSEKKSKNLSKLLAMFRSHNSPELWARILPTKNQTASFYLRRDIDWEKVWCFLLRNLLCPTCEKARIILT